MKNFKHGLSGYNHHKCRCDTCKLARKKAIRKWRLTPNGKKSSNASNAKYEQTPKGRVNQAKKWARYDLKRLATLDGQLKKKAHNAVMVAVRDGKLNPEPCFMCWVYPAQAHHHLGYTEEHKLDVQWLCKKCHAQIHREPKMEAK